MAKINTHGIKMVGLRKASGDTRNYYDSRYIQISYDRDNGDILTDLHSDWGRTWETVYHEPGVIKICTTSRHLTMQEIADRIAEAVDEAKRYAEEQVIAGAC